MSNSSIEAVQQSPAYVIVTSILNDEKISTNLTKTLANAPDKVVEGMVRLQMAINAGVDLWHLTALAMLIGRTMERIDNERLQHILEEPKDAG